MAILGWALVLAESLILTAAVVLWYRGPRAMRIQWMVLNARITSGNASPETAPDSNRAAPITAADSLFERVPKLVAAGLANMDPAVREPAAAGDTPAAGSAGDIVPVEKRWKLAFDAGLSNGSYARQLDALGMELGVVQGDGTTVYVSQLSEARPVVRSAASSDDKRLYFSWDRGDLSRADRTLLANAGVDATNKIVLHFCPDAAVAQLTKLESEHAGARLQRIQRTRFGLKRTFRGYEIYVVDQTVR